MFQTCSKLDFGLEWLLGIMGLGSRQTGVFMICCIDEARRDAPVGQEETAASFSRLKMTLQRLAKRTKARCDANVS
jgi:hypothetical protein